MHRVTRAKIAKAEQFLEAALLMEEYELYDASVSLAVSAAINASDALIYDATQSLPSGSDHSAAVGLLRRSVDRQSSIHLSRALSFKNPAQYSINRCSLSDSQSALKCAIRLVEKSKTMETPNDD